VKEAGRGGKRRRINHHFQCLGKRKDKRTRYEAKERKVEHAWVKGEEKGEKRELGNIICRFNAAKDTGGREKKKRGGGGAFSSFSNAAERGGGKVRLRSAGKRKRKKKRVDTPVFLAFQ